MEHIFDHSAHTLLKLLATFVFALPLTGQEPPDVRSLENMLPDPLVSEAGKPVRTLGDWEEGRREEVLNLFLDEVYGRIPARQLRTGFKISYYNGHALGGKAIQKEVNITVSNGTEHLTIPMLVFLPGDREGPVPLFIGLNFYGNQSVHPDKEISITPNWVGNRPDWGIDHHRAGESSRGVRSSRWPVERILERGYGLATIYAGDIDPDFDDGFRNGVHALLKGNGSSRDEHAWGTLATWAWGLSRALDYFETDPEVDAHRVAVIGHSRMGKTALWAGASDERFALVISNNSGCGGAALSLRKHGETVERINTSFPHWFAPAFTKYNNHEEELPVDQHMLLSLVAPRPLYVASAEEDDWADPVGEYLSLYYASRVYALYGLEPFSKKGLPEVDHPVRSGKLGYHIRSGGHDLTRYDWEQYLDFADRFLKNPGNHQETNPVTFNWVKEHLRTDHPRLVITPDSEKIIREQIASGDETAGEGIQVLHMMAASILDLEPLERRQTGKRLLGVSREAIRRLTTLALLCRLDYKDEYLVKLEEELRAVCSFSDWNPPHFLDVAEMAAGVALALDWAGEWMSGEVRSMARKALVEMALKPSMEEAGYNYWVSVDHNWNLVCHGGLSLAALEMFEEEPELCTAVLARAVRYIPLALEPYAPDGIYPEGPSYWFYATTYLTLSVSAFESALGTDFGFTASPGVRESTVFSRVLAGPSGLYYNYFDASLEGFGSVSHLGLLSWFSRRTGSGFNREAFTELLHEGQHHPGSIRSTRYFSYFLINALLAGPFKEMEMEEPSVWWGRGGEPIVVFRDPGRSGTGFFLAAKGGRAADNHGNMDAGSFILEMDGIRWSVDPGNQEYNRLEQIMGNELWNQSQDSRRWSLLTKNNLGHSTLTVNDALYTADARAGLVEVDVRSGHPAATFDLTPVFGEDVHRVYRTFSRESPARMRIVDQVEVTPHTRSVTWQMITQATVTRNPEGAILSQDGKTLFLDIPDDTSYSINIVNLSPPPLSYDKNIPGLKRIEIRWDPAAFTGGITSLGVDLFSGMANRLMQ